MEFFEGKLSEVKSGDIQRLNEYIQKQNQLVLASENDESRISVVNCLHDSTLEKTYIMSYLSSNKIQNILTNSRVEVLFHDDKSMLIITGEARLIDSLEKKEQMFEPWMNMYLKEGYKDKEYALVEIVPIKIRYFI